MMRLRHGTYGAEKAHARHTFRSAFAVAAASTALLLASGATNPVFANKAPLHHPDSSFSWAQPAKSPSSETVAQRKKGTAINGQQLHGTCTPSLASRLRYAFAEFRWRSREDFLAQDYGVIEKINEPLPPERKISVSEWLSFQQSYLDAKVSFSDWGLATSLRKSAVSDAMERTRNHAYKMAPRESADKKRTYSQWDNFVSGLTPNQLGVLAIVFVLILGAVGRLGGLPPGIKSNQPDG